MLYCHLETLHILFLNHAQNTNSQHSLRVVGEETLPILVNLLLCCHHLLIDGRVSFFYCLNRVYSSLVIENLTFQRPIHREQVGVGVAALLLERVTCVANGRQNTIVLLHSCSGNE